MSVMSGKTGREAWIDGRMCGLGPCCQICVIARVCVYVFGGGGGGGGINKSTFKEIGTTPFPAATAAAAADDDGGGGWYHSKGVPFEFSGEGCDRISPLDGIVTK